MPQNDSARAYDAVRHAVILRAMPRRGVPYPLALAYLSVGRSHEGWATEPTQAGVGPRPWSSVHPGLEPLRETWTRQGFGLALDEDTLTHLAWADGVWFASHSIPSPNAMLQDVSKTTEATTELETRWDQCNSAIDGESSYIGRSGKSEDRGLLHEIGHDDTSVGPCFTCAGEFGRFEDEQE